MLMDFPVEICWVTTRQIFREADADDSGDLDREELRIALRTLAASSGSVVRVLSVVVVVVS